MKKFRLEFYDEKGETYKDNEFYFNTPEELFQALGGNEKEAPLRFIKEKECYEEDCISAYYNYLSNVQDELDIEDLSIALKVAKNVKSFEEITKDVLYGAVRIEGDAGIEVEFIDGEIYTFHNTRVIELK